MTTEETCGRCSRTFEDCTCFAIEPKKPFLVVSQRLIDAALREGVAVIVDGNPMWMGAVLIPNKPLGEGSHDS